jgi:hypothetical protein
MAQNTPLASGGSQPVVEITAGHPQRYSFTVVLQKPPGQLWPDGKPGKLILSGVFDNQNQARASATIQEDPRTLDGCSLQWVVFVKVPGGGRGQFRVSVTVSQDGNVVGGPFSQSGVVDNTTAVSDFTDFDVA